MRVIGLTSILNRVLIIKSFDLVKHPRLEPYYVSLSKREEERFESLLEELTVVDLHEHPVLWPEDMEKVPDCID